MDPICKVVRIERGHIYISAMMYEEYFSDTKSAALFQRDQQICLIPLRQEAGGLLIKLKNIKGDRVIDANEFLRGIGITESWSGTAEVEWDHAQSVLNLSFNL